MKKKDLLPRLVSLYNAGKPVRQIADECGMTTCYAWLLLRQAGYSFQRPLRTPEALRPKSSVPRKRDCLPRLIEMRQAGMTRQEMADETGLSRVYISLLLSEAKYYHAVERKPTRRWSESWRRQFEERWRVLSGKSQHAFLAAAGVRCNECRLDFRVRKVAWDWLKEGVSNG